MYAIVNGIFFFYFIFGLFTPGERVLDVTGIEALSIEALKVRAVVGRHLTNKSLLTVVVSIVKTGTEAEKEYQMCAWPGGWCGMSGSLRVNTKAFLYIIMDSGSCSQDIDVFLCIV